MYSLVITLKKALRTWWLQYVLRLLCIMFNHKAEILWTVLQWEVAIGGKVANEDQDNKMLRIINSVDENKDVSYSVSVPMLSSPVLEWKRVREGEENKGDKKSFKYFTEHSYSKIILKMGEETPLKPSSRSFSK